MNNETPKSIVTRLADMIDQNALGKMADWVSGIFKGSISGDEYPYTEEAKERWEDAVDVFLPIEKAIYQALKSEIQKSSHQPLVFKYVKVCVEPVQSQRLLQFLEKEYQILEPYIYGGEFLRELIKKRVLNSIQIYQNLPLSIDTNFYLQVQIQEGYAGGLITADSALYLYNVDAIFEPYSTQSVNQTQQPTSTVDVNQVSVSATIDKSPSKEIEYVIIEIQDSLGKRQHTITQFPVEFGRECKEPDILVLGTFVSSKHILLDTSGGTLFVQNLSHKNSIFVNNQVLDKYVHGQKNIQRCEVKVKDNIHIARHSLEHVKYPIISIVQVKYCEPVPSHEIKSVVVEQSNPSVQGYVPPITPVLENDDIVSPPVTPIIEEDIYTPPVTPMLPIFRLQVMTHEGEKWIDINQEQLPCIIGRTTQLDESKHYRHLVTIPSVMTAVEKNVVINSVSREHLVLVDFNGEVLYAQSIGAYGTYIEGVKQEQSFSIAVNQTVVLGRDTIPVSITLIVDETCIS